MGKATLVSMSMPDIFLLCTNTCPLLMVLWEFPLGRTKSEGCIHGENILDGEAGSFDGSFQVKYGDFPVTLRFSDTCIGRKRVITTSTEVL